jgi:EF-P beta-lysylation protein EpmB
MIPLQQPPVWRQILRTNFTQWQKLADFLELSEEQRAEIKCKPQFILNLPFRLAKKIKKGTLEDPLLKQFLPTIQENKESPEYRADPINDGSFCRTPKLLQKYEGRALLLCTSACAMHCRYCFRQNYPYETSDHGFESELQEVASDPSLHEIILSGGDPLSLSDEILLALFNKISSIPHIRRVRFHTRFPMGIPERINETLLNLFKNLDKQIWFIIHSNHSLEFDKDVWESLSKIRKLGIPILNQSVLLRGINDNIDTLKKLCEDLVDHGISPYYIHQLDRVQGASHFEVSEERGRQLIQDLRKQLSGYAIPLYVREIPGELSKIPL